MAGADGTDGAAKCDGDARAEIAAKGTDGTRRFRKGDGPTTEDPTERPEQ